MNEKITKPIRISIENKKQLDIMGNKGDSYDDIIKKLINKYKGVDMNLVKESIIKKYNPKLITTDYIEKNQPCSLNDLISISKEYPDLSIHYITNILDGLVNVGDVIKSDDGLFRMAKKERC